MKFDLPNIAHIPKKTIYVFEDNDCVAYKNPGNKWMVKVIPCNNCGECCKRFHMDYDFPPIKNGVCNWLYEGGCELGRHRPFKCAIATPGGDYCCVKFEEVK